MRIGIDARWIFHQISGIGAYTLALIEHLAKIEQDEHTFILFFNHDSLLERTLDQAGIREHPRVTCVLIPYGVHSPLSQLRLPGVLKQQKLDIFHSTNYMIPLLAFPSKRTGKIRCITTIHDMIPMRFPNAAPNSKKTRLFPLYKKIMRMVGARADRIITDSNASRSDIIEGLRIPEAHQDKVRTIYCGVGEEFNPGDTPDVLDYSTNRTRVILYVGRADPYKNLVGLIRAFSQARMNATCDMKLIIAGAKDDRYPEAADLVRELDIEGHVSWTGYIHQNDLVKAYRDADALCLPSRCEGFGLPVVEAMASGTPVICSNAGSLPEVAGDAAILFDPDDIEALSSGLVNILTDPHTARNLVDLGYKQAATFSWTRTAAQTMALYEELTP